MLREFVSFPSIYYSTNGYYLINKKDVRRSQGSTAYLEEYNISRYSNYLVAVNKEAVSLASNSENLGSLSTIYE